MFFLRKRYALLLALAILGFTQLTHPSTAQAYVSSGGYPVIFVHGFAGGDGITCTGPGGLWSNPQAYLANPSGHRGLNGTTIHYTGQTYAVGYYNNDRNCNQISTAYNRCSGYYDGYVGTPDEDIRHIACALAWWLYDNFTVFGNQNVQVVAHSMGGLAIRWAIHGVQVNDHGVFPPSLRVQDVVTMSTPHQGITDSEKQGLNFGCTSQRGLPYCWQVLEMGECSGCADGNFMHDLYAYADNPQASSGTDWTMMGSLAPAFLGVQPCEALDWHAATYMSGGHRLGYNMPIQGTGIYYQYGYCHGDYVNDQNDDYTAPQYFCDWCGRDDNTHFQYTTQAPHSLHNMLFALLYPDW